MKKQTAIIVGAGIGGLATAIQLARANFDVTIFEKNHLPGGRCRQMKKEGHTFDIGPTMLLFPEIFKDFFTLIGEDFQKHIKLLQVDPVYQLNFSDNTHLILTSNLDKMRSQLEDWEKGSYKRFLDYLKYGKSNYDLVVNKIAKKDFIYPWQYFNPYNLYLTLKNRSLIPHYLHTKSFFKDPRLSMAFTFQDSYLGLSPYNSPFVYSLFTYSDLVLGNFLPKGGMYQIIKALEKIAKKNKVKFFYNSPVKKINIDGKYATGVTLKNNRIKNADCLMVNADLGYTYCNLLPDTSQAQKFARKKRSCSVLIFNWGLNKVYPQLKTHNLFFSNSYKAGFDEVLKKNKPPLSPHFYIQAPTRTDPTRAPKGQDTISVMIPINKINPKHPVDWKEYKNQVRKYVISYLEKIGLKDFEENIKFESSFTPPDWQDYLNLPNGSVYSFDHNMMQLGYLRPSRVHSKYKNLFFVGAGNHPGSGLPTVLLSSQFTSKRIIDKYQIGG